MATIDEIYERIEDKFESLIYDKNDSEVAHFFDGQTLFITGVSGYLGKCLLEKLLRSCSGIKHIYVLMRETGGYTLEQRTKRCFENVIFSRLRKEYPDFEEKVTVLKGDLVADKLGLSDEDKSTIVNNVTIIYHNAANVLFEVKPSVSLRVNTLGTKQMLELAQECKNLKEFVYVSTAYSHLYKQHIYEESYPSPADLKTVYNAIEADERSEEGLTEEELKALIGKYPNIYPYSKAIAEDLVRQCAENAKFACVIYRPSIVTSTYKEPLAGWCGNKNGPVYVFLAAALGFIRVAHYLDYPIDFIPLDLAINALLVITRDAHDKWKNNNQQQVNIYNYGSSTTNPLTLMMVQRFIDALPPIQKSGKAVALSETVMLVEQLWLFYILHAIFHFLPSCLIDLILLLSGRKPMVLSIFWKATRHMDKMVYFGNGNWKIHMTKTLEVIDKLSPADNEHFFCDIRKLNMAEASEITWRGLKYYLLKEDVLSEAGRRRYYLLCWVHYITRAIFFLVFCYILYKLQPLVF